MRGNHHDAWVNGANDPVSGAGGADGGGAGDRRAAPGGLDAAAHDRVRGLGRARSRGSSAPRNGWRRTRRELRREGRRLHQLRLATAAASSPWAARTRLERLVNQAARGRERPADEASTCASGCGRAASPTRRADERKEARERADLRLDALGSGSDYTPFLQHLGIASLNLGFGGEDGGGTYHSIYDSFDHYTRFGDPTFAYGVALARTVGRGPCCAWRRRRCCPSSSPPLAETVGRYVDGGGEAGGRPAGRDRGAEPPAARADPGAGGRSDSSASSRRRRGRRCPTSTSRPLHNARRGWSESARRFERPRRQARRRAALAPQTQKALDAILHGRGARAHAPRRACLGRPWFVHHVYAPGFYTGYGVKTLPGVREALEQRTWPLAEAQIVATASALEALAGQLDKATALLDR